MSVKKCDKILLAAMVVAFSSFVKASESAAWTSVFYEQTIGYFLVGEPYHRITTHRPNTCVMTCASSVECQYINVLNGSDSGETQCELFNDSMIVDEASLIKSANSILYKAIPFKDCLEAKTLRKTRTSGIYPIMLPCPAPTKVFCDMETDNGGWTLLLRRIGSSLDFDRDWQSYKVGFGDLESDFWLGLDAAHLLTSNGNITLRFDLWDGSMYYFIEYYGTTIADNTDNYRLNWINYSGNVTDSLASHRNMEFSTKDNDNDPVTDNCASAFNGGWWYFGCQDVKLTGVYGATSHGQGINWEAITGFFRSLSKAEMKVRLNV